MSYNSSGSGCYFFILAVALVCSVIYAVSSWIYGAATGHKAEHAALLADTRNGIISSELGARVIRIHGIMKRQRLEGNQWVYAGENETMGTYPMHVAGEGKVECKKDVRDMTEGEGFYRRELSAEFSANVGKTLITKQGSVTEGPEKEQPVELLVEKHRPALMDGCDEAAGWTFSVYGRWPGSTGDGLEFADLLDGTHPGVSAVSDTIRGNTVTRIRVERSTGVDIYWVDPYNGYEFIRWEHRAGHGPNEHEIAAWEVKAYMSTPHGFTFPDSVDGERMGPDGKLIEKWHVDITDIWINGDDDEANLYQLKVPAGKVVLKEDGKPEKMLTGTAEENSKAINGGWGGASTQNGAATQGNLK